MQGEQEGKLQEVAANDISVRFEPAGIHFFSRRTGVNVLCDEVRVPTELCSRAPSQLSIALTNACDLSCHFCYAPKVPAILPTEIVCEWLSELSIGGCLGVGFGGGEPTLHPYFAEICEFGAERTRLAVTMTTHAHRITDSLAERLRDHVHFIRVSMDGVGLTYEKIRGKSFASLNQKLALVRSIAPFGINCVVNPLTVLELDSIIEVAEASGASELLLLPQRPTSSCSGIKDSTIQVLHQWIRQYRGPLPLAISEEYSAGLECYSNAGGETELRSYAHINARGFLMRSSYESAGVPIDSLGVLHAIKQLEEFGGEQL